MEPTRNKKETSAFRAFDGRAAEYREKFSDQSKYRPVLERLCNALNAPDARVLDLACGPGNLSRELLSIRSELRILGIDFSPAMIDCAQAALPAAKFRVMDIRSIDLPDSQFDAAVCGFGLPYLSRGDAEELMRQLAVLIRSGGTVFLSTMEGRYEESGWESPSEGGAEQLYTYYYTVEDLELMLHAAGFDIRHSERLPGPDPEARTELIVIGRKAG